MKNKLLISILSIFFIVSGFSQTKTEKESKALSATIEKNKKGKPSKKILELRKKLAYYQSHSPFSKNAYLSVEEGGKNGVPPNKYFESEWELTMNPVLGRPTTENLEVIRKQLLEERQRILATGRVPGDAVDNAWVERGPTNVGGRTRAIMFDPNDATRETVFAGGVSGGLWKNTAISNSGSTWTRVNISDNLNVSCLAYDPNNTNIFYVGTGESWTGGDAGGDGVWKSINGGATWSKVFGGVSGPSVFTTAANLTVNSPTSVAGTYPCIPNTSFGAAITTPITANVVLVNDGVSAPTSLGCGASAVGSLTGKIALIRRGSCPFSDKIKFAQDAGAIAVIMMNNTSGPPISMGGTDANALATTIPSIMITITDGNLIEAALAIGVVNVTLNPSAAGAVSGNIVPGAQHINKIAIRNNAGVSEVFVAVADSYYGDANATTYMGANNYGVYKTNNGGASWTLLNLPLTPAGNKHCPNDIEIGADNKIWVATKTSFSRGDGGGKVFCSADGGATFTDKYTVTANGGGARTEIEASATNPNLIYVLAQLKQASATQGIEVQIIKTTDGFATTTTPALPTVTLNPAARTDTYGFTGAQAWYDLVIEADPSNDQIVCVGGIDLFRSADGAATWNQISTWNSGSSVHSDHHAITFKPGNSNTVVFGTDGGVYYCGDLPTATANSGITSRNSGFNVTQFYAVGVAPTSTVSGLTNDHFVAGAQDNGTQYFSAVTGTTNSSSRVQGGDGGVSLFDQGFDKYMITNYVWNQSIYSRTTTGGSKLLNSESTENGAFIAQMALDSSRDILYADYGNSTAATYGIRRYTNTNPANATASVKSTITNALITTFVTALTVSKYTTNATVLLAGLKNGKLIRSANANTTTVANVTWTDITGPEFIGSISDVELGASNNDIFVTFHNYNVVNIWYSSDGGASWENKEGNLPDMPVKCILQNPLKLNEVIIGTDLGVWFTSTFDTASPVWFQSFNGMSNVKVTDLDLRNDNAVYASTYGRGVFSGLFTNGTLANEDFSNKKGVSISPNPSNGVFNISINQYSGNVNIQVVDLNGRIVYSAKNEMFNSEKAIDLKSVESGIYVLRISGADLNYSQKIIKN
jgi:hypothetical protein